MGQSFMKFVPGSEESKEKEIGSTIEECYKKYFKADSQTMEDMTKFHHAICKTVEDINRKLHSTQIRIPEVEKLRKVFDKHVDGKGPLTEDKFHEILRELIMDIRLTGFGSKDTFLYVFGIPAAALFFKRRLQIKAIGDDLFIPGVTSFTVFLLAKIHKI